jgi:hypothetical protein
MGIIDEPKLMREHYEILADIKSLKRDLLNGEATQDEILKKIEILEEKARTNDREHKNFVRAEALIGIQESLHKLESGTVVMTPKQAKDAGESWLGLLLKNPTHLMWLILAAVVITMVFMGYSYAEISQVLDRMR